MSSSYGMPWLLVGDQLNGVERCASEERMGWYSSGLGSAATGAPRGERRNIHTDVEVANEQGLSTAIADGMISTNWVSELLEQVFGVYYLARGSLRTKFVAPVVVGTFVRPRARVEEAVRKDDGETTYRLKVWCEDSDGRLLTEGEATVPVPGVPTGEGS